MNRLLYALAGFGVHASRGLGMAEAQCVEGRTFTLDAVELVRNRKETKGDPKHSVERDGYAYHFASRENKAAFESEPTRHEIQMGGACGRMGPLNGQGRFDTFAVHAGKLNPAFLTGFSTCEAYFRAAPVGKRGPCPSPGARMTKGA